LKVKGNLLGKDEWKAKLSHIRTMHFKEVKSFTIIQTTNHTPKNWNN